jgi:hypothetical protein
MTKNAHIDDDDEDEENMYLDFLFFFMKEIQY